MEKVDREKMTFEWQAILKNHPRFARAFLAQQAILMEAAEMGVAVVDIGMCKLLEARFPVLFADYWADRCQQRVIREVEIGGMIGCLSQTNRDPARCFGNDEEDGWFDDPFAEGNVLPPVPPIPPL